MARPTLKASKSSKAALRLWHDARRRELEDQARERVQAEVRAAERHLQAVTDKAEASGEEVARDGKGPVHVARDGLAWTLRKGTIERVHSDAGLRFRADYETANSGGLRSCIDESTGGRGFSPHTSGPTDAMIAARGRVKAALAALGTPLLEGYVVLVAGEGAMLTDPRIGGAKGASDHALPCRIAFDMLARHYGMVR